MVADARPPVPREPIDRLVGPLARFLHVEAASGVVLLVCAVTALVLANSPAQAWFLGLWKTNVSIGLGSFEMSHSLKHWINDGLMAIFFFVVGLEIKRELIVGELRFRPAGDAAPSSRRSEAMVVPAGSSTSRAPRPAHRRPRTVGAIPMATDIAFALGIHRHAGRSRAARPCKRVPGSLSPSSTTSSPMLVIAIFYTEGLHTTALAPRGASPSSAALVRR